VYSIARFSALQRAENSSIVPLLFSSPSTHRFQCSSASRKFLNVRDRLPELIAKLFQCSSASRKFLNCAGRCARRLRKSTVSVLFSEPKIPQFHNYRNHRRGTWGFSALQRAENSSMPHFPDLRTRTTTRFQCSSASRKFLNLPTVNLIQRHCAVSVLFSEPKIPQSDTKRTQQ